MKLRALPLTLSVSMALAGAAWLAPTPADACGNSIRHKIHKPTKSVKKAEQLLADGKYERAVEMVRGLYPTVHRFQHGEANELQLRGQRVVALAVIRSGGQAQVGSKLRGRDVQAREVRLAWATMALDVQTWHDPDDLVLRTELAEALATNPVHHARAHTILDDLARRDLMPTARGYMILAALEKTRGDEDQSQAALNRCKEIAAGRGGCVIS